MRALPLSLVVAVVAGVGGCTAATASGPATPDEAPVVIELFTSQGCSSCPPADELLARLAHAGQSNGRAVVPLAFHVDYWNDGGWADPYSSPAWTQRQQQYARALSAQIYTPEVVVAGSTTIVGSQRAGVAVAIASAPRQLAIAATARWSPASVAVDATAPADADVWVAVWEDAAPTKVPAGENSGATLVTDRVVRALVRVAAAGQPGHVSVPLDPRWTPGGAVAFAQRPDLRIVGARVLGR